MNGARLTHGRAGEYLRQHYEVRQVADGDAAWQVVLLDGTVRVLVIDAGTAPGAAFDLLARVRASKVHRIRELPAVAVTGALPDAQRQRLGELNATELVVGETADLDLARELVLRLRVLAELSITREALAESRIELESVRTVDPETDLLHLAAFDQQVTRMISYARRSLSDVALVCLRVELTLANNETWDGEIEQRMKLVGRALSAAVRLEDLAARSDAAEFCVATPNNGMTDVLRFAARLRKVLENTDAAGPGVEVWTCIGIAMLTEELRRDAPELRAQAQRRAHAAQAARSRRIMLGAAEPGKTPAEPALEAGSMDIALALALIGSGRSAEVVAHLPQLLRQLNPLIRLIQQQQRILTERGELPADGGGS